MAGRSPTRAPLHDRSRLRLAHDSQALGDRRVRVAIDETGRVQYVSPDSTAVFGFNPLALKGKVLGDFIQGLSVRSSLLCCWLPQAPLPTR